ncbi:unnamed protein product [Caenorhabditis angaria]|uniref:THAP-type domain-containing protein n=1 Tax=Caenorhabditis angaria TaxID=860376 RepID=A0A9P1N315_9PELO|nr:unnamed protein product [Caenorhabditis angaria]
MCDAQQTNNLDNRRRKCVVCEKLVSFNYATSFTSVADKQKLWAECLMGGNEQLAEELLEKTTKGRKYICFDHFGKEHFRQREDGKIELVRNAFPLAFNSTEEVQKLPFDEKMFEILVNASNYWIEETMRNVK